MKEILHIFNHTILITAFVSAMMLVIEYINVITEGVWQNRLIKSRWSQYLLAGFLGVLPGCLGPFAAVAMFSHGVITLGALVTAMIATSGDESFVMLALIPDKFLMISLILFLVSIPAGIITDLILRKKTGSATRCCEELNVHHEETAFFFSIKTVMSQWKRCSPIRGITSAVLIIFVFAVIFGEIGPQKWNWIRISIVSVTFFSLFIVISVTDHFLEEHLWEHVVKRHAWIIFLWTLGAFIFIHFFHNKIDSLINTSEQGIWSILVVACLVGLIPESGPHLVFVTLFSEGYIPLSILLASSIVQDGHGMIPVLAHSRKMFIIIKVINMLTGFAVGAAGLLAGI